MPWETESKGDGFVALRCLNLLVITATGSFDKALPQQQARVQISTFPERSHPSAILKPATSWLQPSPAWHLILQGQATSTINLS